MRLSLIGIGLPIRTQMRQQLGPTRPRLGVPRHAVNVRNYLVEPMGEIAAPLSTRKQKDAEAYSPRITGSITKLLSLRLNHSITFGCGFGLVASHNTLASTGHLMIVIQVYR